MPRGQGGYGAGRTVAGGFDLMDKPVAPTPCVCCSVPGPEAVGEEQVLTEYCGAESHEGESVMRWLGPPSGMA